MKKVFSFLSAALLAAAVAFGQDARGRLPETVVNDVLAATPAKDTRTAAGLAADLAVSAPETVVLLADRLAPGAPNALAEYALSDVVAYVSDAPGSAYRDAVRKGLRQGIRNQSDATLRHFLLQQLRLIATDEDVAFFEDYAADPEAAATAVAALVDLPAGGNAILRLLSRDDVPKAILADAVAEKKLKSAEPVLLAWGATATGADRDAVNAALGVIGSSASAGYLKLASPADYAVLVGNLPRKAAVSAAKDLVKRGSSADKCAGVKVLMAHSSRKDGLKVLSSALRDADRPFRNTALEAATLQYGTAAVAGQLRKDYDRLGVPARTDVVNWLAVNKVADMNLLFDALDAGGELEDAAIRTAGVVGGAQSLAALMDKLGSEKAPRAMEALLSFEGELEPAVVAGLAEPGNQVRKDNLMTLAGRREMKKAAPAILEEALKGNKAALAALSGVVGPADVNAVADVLEKVSEDNAAAARTALLAAVHTETPEKQLETIRDLMARSAAPARYYPAVASLGTDGAVDLLRSLAPGNPRAREALLSMDNPAVLPDLAEAAKDSEVFLEKYIDMLAQEKDPDEKRYGLADALSLAADAPALRARALNALGTVPTMKAFLLAGRFLDDSDADVRMAAAEAVKGIAARTAEEINYDDFKACLEKAADIYRARGWADDGYAVDEIGKMLLEAQPSPRSELTEEEKREGFVMLFDGSDLSNWHGDREGYTVMNGTIYVSADYGSTGNLYTNEQYRNFIYRFEFCFLREGVNNGVGIRTPENVDAAYDGMCEVQILDHDAPMYADLRPYQVHGSVYGIVPAKRIVHKPLGEWSTEEIVVNGNHVKVTVNGEVIVDADVRTATKGHNVAPDGSGSNPYTVDGRNHPGLFNEKGYISFCGHGEGLKIRNVRIKDLGSGK